MTSSVAADGRVDDRLRGRRRPAARTPAAARPASAWPPRRPAARGAPRRRSGPAPSCVRREERDGQRVAPERGVLGGEDVLQRARRGRCRRAVRVRRSCQHRRVGRAARRHRRDQADPLGRQVRHAAGRGAALRRGDRLAHPGQGHRLGDAGRRDRRVGGGRAGRGRRLRPSGRRCAASRPPARPRRPAPRRARCGPPAAARPGRSGRGSPRSRRRPARRRRGPRRPARSAGPGPRGAVRAGAAGPEPGRGHGREQGQRQHAGGGPGPAAGPARAGGTPPDPAPRQRPSRRLILPGRSPRPARYPGGPGGPDARVPRASRTGPDDDPEDQETPTMSPPRPTPARSAQARSAQVPAPRRTGRRTSCAACWNRSSPRPGSSSTRSTSAAAGRRHTVRLVVDSDAGVGLDDIARISRAASDELDGNEHLVGGSYTLEVTSPGVDRPLTTPRHWRRARLRLVAVRAAGRATRSRAGSGRRATTPSPCWSTVRCARCATPTSPTPRCRSSSPRRPRDGAARSLDPARHDKAAEDPE